MITKLTDEQIARFPEFVEKWKSIGLSTEPADRPRAEAGIAKAYEIAGLKPPRIVWCGSPFSQGLTRAIVMGLKKPIASVGDSVRASVWASVRASVGDSVRASVGDSVRASVWASVGDSVRASVGDSVWASVRASVGDSVWDSVYGQHEAGWLSYIDYFATACGLTEQTQKLAGIFEVAQSANWWLPHEKICWVSERHNVLNRDERGRLHCESGPALQYPDGWSIYAIGGVRADEQIVMNPQTQTVEQIKKESNEEIRRIRIERFGWERFLKESGAKVREQCRNERDTQDESLYRLDDGTQRFVCVDPSTGRRYALGVPSEIQSCEQAQMWMSHNLDLYATHRS